MIKRIETVSYTHLEKNKDSKWAKDIVAAYKSDEFKSYMDENNKNNYWFIPEELR